MDQVRFNEVLATITKKGEEYVDCSSLGLNDEQLGILISAIEGAPIPPKSLNLGGNHITNAGAVALAAYLKTSSVSEVHVPENDIGDEGAMAFFSVFEPSEGHPTSFDMRGNPCTEHLIIRLGFLAKSQSLNESVKHALMTKQAETVSFDGLPYQDLESRLIRYVLLDVEGLVTVDFSNTTCGDNGLVAIAEILKDSSVQHFIAHKCAVGTNGCLSFVQTAGIPTHKTLTEIVLTENKNITNEFGLQVPNLVFNTNTIITKFDLTGTFVSPELRQIIDKECELNQQPATLKAAVVALRVEAPEAKEVNLQWEKGVSRCMEFMWRYIRDSTVIETLNISNAGVNDEALELLSRSIAKNTTLRVIELANNKFTAEGVKALFAQIQRGKCGVQEVNLGNNDLGDDSTTPLINAVRGNPNLKVLNIDVNPRISEDYVNEIGGLILVNRSPALLRTLLPAIEKDTPTLEEVDLSDPTVTYNDECVRMICQALMLNTRVRKLNFSHNVIGDIGAVYIAELLAPNSTITEINLTGNSIGNRGAQRICESLHINKTLVSLTLDDNMLGAEGVAGFPEMLRTNHSLRSISMEKTRVPVETAATISRACDINRDSQEVKTVYYRLIDNDDSMTDIDLSEKKRARALDDLSIQTICGELKGRSFVKTVNLSGNAFGPDGCARLAEVLSDENCAITHLVLSKNALGDAGFAELTKCFGVNKSLVDLDLRETGITDEGCGAAVPAMQANDTILNIVVDDTIAGPGVIAFKRMISLNNEPIALKHVILRLEGGEAIEEIDLQSQKDRPFGDSACNMLCVVLEANQHLRLLNLSGNKITVRSMTLLVEAINTSPNLAYIDVSNNAIDGAGADVLIGCLETNAVVRALSVHGNPMPTDKQERIAQLLAMNLGSQKLKKVLLQHSRGERLEEALDFNSKHTGYTLTDDETLVLAHILRNVTEVRAVDLGNNDIGDSGCVAIAEVLRANHTMEALYLDQNRRIGLASGDALFYALKINPQLHTLNIDGTEIPSNIREDIESLLHINQTSVKDRIDMRSMRVEQLDDNVQFKSTDYYTTQQDLLETEALDNCKRTEMLLLN